MDWKLASLGVGVTFLGTGLGALPAFALGSLSARTNNLLIGFSAGIMLSASSFSLILPALGLAKLQCGNPFMGALLVGTLIWFGALFLYLCNRYIPHEHFVSGREGGPTSLQLKRIWLFIFAITLHNFPEGLAVGSSIGGQSLTLALPVIAGIGLQDMPEGFVVAASLLSVGYRRATSIFVAVITGIVESIAAVIGLLMTSSMHSLLPWSLAFAGGAMTYVVLEEMIPEIRSKSPVGEGTAGVLFGFVLMMILDVALGG